MFALKFYFIACAAKRQSMFFSHAKQKSSTDVTPRGKVPYTRTGHIENGFGGRWFLNVQSFQINHF